MQQWFVEQNKEDMRVGIWGILVTFPEVKGYPKKVGFGGHWKGQLKILLGVGSGGGTDKGVACQNHV